MRLCSLDCIQPFISQSSHYDSPGASARRHNTLSASSNSCTAVWSVPCGPVPDPSTILSTCPHPGPCQSQSGHPRLQLPHGAGQRQLWQGKHSRPNVIFSTHNRHLWSNSCKWHQRGHSCLKQQRLFLALNDFFYWWTWPSSGISYSSSWAEQGRISLRKKNPFLTNMLIVSPATARWFI